MPFCQKAANLARIRDNQRRSRARRNDYLKDLEAKYNSCTQAGVSASAEIQAAAKGVVEENRRLRQLLKDYGIPDAEIDRVSGRTGSVAANNLEAMANSRRPCGPSSGCQSSPQPGGQASQSLPIQPMQQTTFQPIASSQPPLAQNIRPKLLTQNLAPQQYPASQLPSPCSLPGRKESYDHGPSPPMQTHHQRPNESFPGYTMPFQNLPPPAQDFHENSMMNFPVPQPHAHYDDLSSCRIAADTIRTFSPDAGYELEQELGCRAPGEECSVPHLRVFNVIDRYTGGSG